MISNVRDLQPSVLIALPESSRVTDTVRLWNRVHLVFMSARAQIRSRHDFRYKYGCLEISRSETTGDATGEGTRRNFRESKKTAQKTFSIRDCSIV